MADVRARGDADRRGARARAPRRVGAPVDGRSAGRVGRVRSRPAGAHPAGLVGPGSLVPRPAGHRDAAAGLGARRARARGPATAALVRGCRVWGRGRRRRTTAVHGAPRRSDVRRPAHGRDPAAAAAARRAPQDRRRPRARDAALAATRGPTRPTLTSPASLPFPRERPPSHPARARAPWGPARALGSARSFRPGTRRRWNQGHHLRRWRPPACGLRAEARPARRRARAKPCLKAGSAGRLASALPNSTAAALFSCAANRASARSA